MKDRPLLEAAVHRRKRPVWGGRRMDETHTRVKGQGYSLDRAVDKRAQTIDSLLPVHRDAQAARRCPMNAIRRHGVPEAITTDGSEAKAAALRTSDQEHGTTTTMRQVT